MFSKGHIPSNFRTVRNETRQCPSVLLPFSPSTSLPCFDNKRSSGSHIYSALNCCGIPCTGFSYRPEVLFAKTMITKPILFRVSPRTATEQQVFLKFETTSVRRHNTQDGEFWQIDPFLHELWFFPLFPGNVLCGFTDTGPFRIIRMSVIRLIHSLTFFQNRFGFLYV